MASISKFHDLEILSLIRYISVMPFSNITFLFRCRIDGWKSAIVYRCRSGTVLYVIDGGGRVKNVTRTAFTRRPRGEKKWRKNPRARETGACAYNQSGIISGDLFGINLAFVARIPANNKRWNKATVEKKFETNRDKVILEGRGKNQVFPWENSWISSCNSISKKKSQVLSIISRNRIRRNTISFRILDPIAMIFYATRNALVTRRWAR